MCQGHGRFRWGAYITHASFVDDNSLIGPVMHLVNEEASKLGVYMGALGVPFKDLKSRTAAMVQLVLGFGGIPSCAHAL